MKKMMFFIISALMSATISYAQSDSTQTKSKSWQAGTADYQNFPTKDMRKLNPKDVPGSLRTTFQGAEYNGWESGSVYFNSATNEYFYQPGSNSAESIKKTSEFHENKVTWYRFDSKGRRLKDPKRKD